jgi:Zn-dependent M28 family amino/carboxypeptidase
VMGKLQGKSPACVLFAQTEAAPAPITPGGGRGGRRNPAAAGAGRAPAQLTFGGDDFGAFAKAAGVADVAKADPVTALPLHAEVAVTVGEGPGPAMNVFAVLPGSDPRLRDEYVVIGSHLDHLGKRGNTILFGADDDASGTTGVMAVARMFAQNPVKPARSILFVCFSGEESGLRGSAHFANDCPIPLSSMVAELQMDMIGRDEEESVEDRGSGEKAEDNRNSLHLVGTKKLSPALHELCLRKNEAAQFDLEYDHEGMFGRSDHANFARKGVPVAFFFTGLHRDYHQPTDTPDKIHYEKLLRVATYVYDIAFDLATQAQRPLIDPQLWSSFRAANNNRVPETPAAPLQPGAADAKAGGEKGSGGDTKGGGGGD